MIKPFVRFLQVPYRTLSSVFWDGRTFHRVSHETIDEQRPIHAPVSTLIWPASRANWMRRERPGVNRVTFDGTLQATRPHSSSISLLSDLPREGRTQ